MTDPATRLNTALQGSYRVERQLGEGGIATFYLATNWMYIAGRSPNRTMPSNTRNKGSVVRKYRNVSTTRMKERSRKEQGQGTGLGLATVYGIVKQSGGNIWLDSRAGEGTTFDVYLPRLAGDEAPAASPAEPVLPLDLCRGTETVLVVEDKAAVRSLVAGILREQGYVVLQAATPAAALDLYQRLRSSKERLDLLVADVVMPGMTGPKLAERMRDGGLDAPVLFMSGYPGGLQPRPGDGFMAKPFSRLQLVREVRRILDA